MKNKKINLMIIVITIIVTSVLASSITYYCINKTNDFNFYGTYQLSVNPNDKSDIQYLSIIDDNQKDITYVCFNSSNDILKKGIVTKIDDNAITINENNKVVASMIYSNGKYYYVQNNKPIVVAKTSKSPISPSNY